MLEVGVRGGWRRKGRVGGRRERRERKKERKKDERCAKEIRYRLERNLFAVHTYITHRVAKVALFKLAGSWK